MGNENGAHLGVEALKAERDAIATVLKNLLSSSACAHVRACEGCQLAFTHAAQRLDEIEVGSSDEG